MSKGTELLPCPFCGGEAEEKHRPNFNAVKCTTCHATVPQSDVGYGDARKLWNRRARPSGVQPPEDHISLEHNF